MTSSHVPYVKLGSLYEPAVYSIGFQLIKEHVRAAADAFVLSTTSLHKAELIAESVAFVKGSDLDVVLTALNTEIDPDRFRETFYEWCEAKRRKFLKSQSSSATMSDVS